MDKTNIIEINNLSKIIQGVSILSNINVNFKSGNIYGIIGKNGSGKSMLFKAICGLINPTQGEIKVFNENINGGNFPKETGVIIENPGFLQKYSGFKNLKILANINNRITDIDIKNTLSLVGLNSEDKRPVKKYSLGMKQKLGIAQAIMEKPKLLILDEPMNALDQESVENMRSLILNLKKNGTTILLCSHNKEDIETLSDHIYIMECGVIRNIN